MAVIFGIAGRQLAAPVEREAEPLQLRLHVGDVGAGPAAGMDALLHRRVLRGHAEGVPAHRMEHFITLHPLVAREHVAHRVVAHVADMDAPRGIGEHLEHIASRLGRGVVGAEALASSQRAANARRRCDGSNVLRSSRRPPAPAWRAISPAPGSRAQVARLGQDDVLEPLHGGRLDRGIDPAAALRNLAAGGDAQRIGAQSRDRGWSRDLDPLAGVAGIGVPVGDDDPARAVGSAAAA